MSAKQYTRVLALLDGERHPAWQRIDRNRAQRCARRFVESPPRSPLAEVVNEPLVGQLIAFLQRSLSEVLDELRERQERYGRYGQQLAATSDPRSRHQLMLDYCRQLGASERQLRGDAQAFDRWFGSDAVAERHERRLAEAERDLIWTAQRLGFLAASWFGRLQATIDIPSAWSLLDLESTLLPLLAFAGDVRVREAALDCLNQTAAALPREQRTRLGSKLLAFTYRATLDRRQPLWVQTGALDLVGRLAPHELLKILRYRLVDPPIDDRDDMFFRRRAVKKIAELGVRQPELFELLSTAVGDPSDWVRQGVSSILPTLASTEVTKLMSVLAADSAPPVVAQLLLVLPELLEQPDSRKLSLEFLQQTLESNAEQFVLRTALHVTPAVYLSLRNTAAMDATETFRQQADQWLTQLNLTAEQTAVRRWAATARGHLWQAQQQFDSLRAALDGVKQMRLSSERRALLPPADGPDSLGRVLAAQASDEFGFDLTDRGNGRWRILRDYRWRPRLWRALHEWRRPASDKRQNYGHLRGRVYRGLMHVPAAAVAEVSQTKVPGEPLQIADEGGYRPYLPLPDQLLSCLDQGWPTQALKVYTAEGITWLTPPAKLRDRLRAKWRLSRRFDQLARLRNWTPTSPFGPDSYLKAVAELGFTVSFSTYVDDNQQPLPADPRVLRFFPVLSPLALASWWQDIREYFYSVYQNTLSQLSVFVVALTGLFFGTHLLANWRLRLARRKIPLVIGGWGTRGKSGTERLKAAVFNALGHRTVSKTTGCEAMFLYGHPNRPTRELFLFRPYDKATIWEQTALVELSAKLGADVYLWECMGLTPRYIRILQRQWMRDDIATICNCFPDHEDIQGPAGVDIPQVMQMFVPRGKVLLTSEENMLPYLTEAAREQNTPIRTVNWLQANLLTADILERFPYEEHPYNIALVRRLAEELELPGDFALKEMADRVVADLGVLKAYAPAPIRRRQLQFINGCSANERHGTLSNWQRMGMGDHALDTDANVWTSTVVNNRADRIARSQVFAAVLVRDIGADRHYLIGSNLDGFMSYVRDAFDRFSTQINWEVGDEGELAERLKQLQELARRWRIPTTSDQVAGRLKAMLAGCDCETEGIDRIDQDQLSRRIDSLPHADRERLVQQWQQDQREQQRFEELAQALGGNRAGLQGELSEQLWQWLQARFVVIDDYHASGNQIIDTIASTTPPGLACRMMGLQNIKGTGLDFVYRWQAWGDHYQYCQGLLSDDPQIVLAAAKALASSQEFGPADAEHVAAAITQAKRSAQGQSEQVQAELSTASANLEQQLVGQSAASGATSANPPSRWQPWVERLEQWLDAGDAVKRRKEAAKIYRDLVDERISHARAARELKRLTGRQKGGWLKKRLNRRTS